MRIGELAGIVGITTRAVRHYHRIGLLPEPARQPNGYREYGLRDAVELARIRRLSELGLSLDEVRDVVAADAGRELAGILRELDADLARQEEAVRERRARLRTLLEQAERSGGRLPAEAPVSPELAAIFDDMARTSARLPGPEPAMAARERELLALLETDASSAGSRHRQWFGALGRSLSGDEDAMRRAYAVYAQMDALAGADVDDPRVEETARAIVASMPEEAIRAVTGPEAAAGAGEPGASSVSGVRGVSGVPGGSGVPGVPGGSGAAGVSGGPGGSGAAGTPGLAAGDDSLPGEGSTTGNGFTPGEGSTTGECSTTGDGFADGDEFTAGDGFAKAFFAEFAPAQAAAVRRAIALISGRAR